MLMNVVPRRWQRTGLTIRPEALACIECNGLLIMVSDVQ